jgi:hypothetical protein
VWVYKFSKSVLDGFAMHIANMSNQDAIHFLLSQTGVKAVTIADPNGNTMPDAAHINFEIENIPGATGSPTPGVPTPTSGSPTGSPTVGPTQQKAPTPTPTTGLGGS